MRIGGDSQRGAVLVVVLWVLAGMSLLALSFSAAIRTEVDASRNVVDQKQGYYLARAGIEYAVYKIMEAQSVFAQVQQLREQGLDALPPALTGTVTLSLPNGTATVELIDETGKLNLNLAQDFMIYNLLVTVGLEPQHADVITASILDWRDRDDLHHENGAESNHYQALPEPYAAKNSLFDVPEELLLVRGVTPEIYYGVKTTNELGEPVEFAGLQKYFTTFSSMNRINVNAASLEVLMAIPELDEMQARAIYNLSQQGPVLNVTEVMEQVPGLPTNVASYLSTIRSNIYTLVSDAKLSWSQAVNRIRCVIRMDRSSPRGYAVLYWNESNLEL